MLSNVIILGKPGSGKSTIAKKLSDNESSIPIDFGKYLRDIASDNTTLLSRYVSTFWSRNNLKEIGHEYFCNEFEKCCSNDTLHFVLTSPKVLDDAKEIDAHMKHKNIQIDAVIELDAPTDTCIERLELKKSINENKNNDNNDNNDSDNKNEDKNDNINEEKDKDDNKSTDNNDTSINNDNKSTDNNDSNNKKDNENEKKEESSSSSKINTYAASDKIQHFEKNITDIRSYYQSQSHITYLTINSNRDPDEVVKDIIEQVNNIKKKNADYSHLETEQEEKEDDEEKSNKYFKRIYGTKRAELVQLMLQLAHNPKPKIPLTHAVPLFGGNINELGNRQYSIIRKLDALRRLIIIYENTFYLISSQYNVFKCDLTFPETSSCDWNNSLFDGEIIISNNSNEACVFILDCLCASKNSVRNEKLATRLSHIKKFAEDFKDSKPVHVYAHNYYSMNQLPILTRLGKNGDPSNSVPAARYVAEGLIFVPTTLRYNIGSSRFLLTWKPIFLHTIDFAAFKEQDEDGNSFIALKSYNHKESSYKTRGEIHSIPKPFESMPDGTIVECNLQNDKWVIYKVKKDKTYPNADWIVSEAIEHLKNPVTQKLLLERVQSIVKKESQKQNTRRNKTSTNRRF